MIKGLDEMTDGGVVVLAGLMVVSAAISVKSLIDEVRSLESEKYREALRFMCKDMKNKEEDKNEQN